MRLFIFCLISLHSSLTLYAQQLRVYSQTAQQPIEGVQALQNDTLAVSNEAGVIDMGGFAYGTTTTLRHVNFYPHTFSWQGQGEITLRRKVTDLQEVIVAAARWEQQKSEIPGKIETIHKEDIRLHQPQTAADLIGLNQDVFIQKSQLGGGSPMIRGFATSRVLLVADRVRLNNAIFRSGNLQNVISLDPQAIRSAEVIFGPGSVSYGSDAIGGVMDFHTLRVPLTGQAPSNKIRYHGRLSSASREKTVHTDFSSSHKKWGMLTSLTFSDFGDMRMGSQGNPDYKRQWFVRRENGRDTVIPNPNPNMQRFSGYKQLNFMQKFRYKPARNWDLRYAFHFSETSDIPRYDRLLQGTANAPKYATWHYGPQHWKMHHLQILHTGTAAYDQLKLTAAWQQYRESRHDRKFASEYLRHRHEQVNAWSLNLDADKKWGPHQLYWGGEWAWNKVFSNAQRENIRTGQTQDWATRYPDGATYAFGAVYLQYKYPLGPHLTFNGGLRFNYHELDAHFQSAFYNFPFRGISLQGQALNFSAGWVWKNDQGLHLMGNLASGYKAPNVDDAAKVFDSGPGKVIVPNPDLGPEQALNAELRAAKTWHGRHQVAIAVFYTRLYNAMVRSPFTLNGEDTLSYDGQPSQVLSLTNTDRATVYGLQASAKFSIAKPFVLDGHINYTRGHTAASEPLRHVAPLFGDISLAYNRRNMQVSLYAHFNGKISPQHLAPSERDKTYMYKSDEKGQAYSPAWWALNTKAQYSFSSAFSLTAGIENMFDIRYRPYSSGIAAPGRNFIVSLQLQL